MKRRHTKCCICGQGIDIPKGTAWRLGHDAWPIKQGRCCSKCEMRQVLPARLRLAGYDPAAAEVLAITIRSIDYAEVRAQLERLKQE